MTASPVVVVRFSPAFGEVWHPLADGLEAELRVVAPGDLAAVPRCAAVVLAAGGAERQVIEWLEGRDVPSEVPVLVVGSDPGRRTAAQVVGHGASDYFALPEDAELLRNTLAAAVVRHRQKAGRTGDTRVAEGLGAFRVMAGESAALEAVLRRAAWLLRHARGTALIVGETGTGKELLARAIHDGGPRRAAPFVPVNCSALPPQLIESELFGHEKGAFTDAHASKPGLFEVAGGGTLFLDEIATLPVDLQAKLLRVLEDHEIRRVGATKSRRVDVRVIAATNADLGEAVRRGTFRQDLYYRLSVITLEMPPLRERGDDVLLVAERLLASLAATHALPAPELGADARRALKEYAWPGNVRELKNGLERALLLSPPGQLNLSELIPRRAPSVAPTSGLPFPAQLDAITAAAARHMLEMCRGNVSAAARRLNISRSRLRRLVQGVRAYPDVPLPAGTN
ncbi:MAG: sigma-54-dependent Fis family transcriptional regulator [Gemmatimonadetes bacterium]|nr:sigma-54-dependent Fis family transcriptional regulator [Gemmatimonadota bacterium]